MVVEAIDAMLGGLRTCHPTISQKKCALVAFPASISYMSTEIAPWQDKGQRQEQRYEEETEARWQQAPFLAGEG
jgi:hypothetical protein